MHSKYSASGAYRFMACPGSIRLCEKAPEQKESIYAQEGSAAHALAEASFKKTIAPLKIRKSFIEKEYQEFIIDEMREFVQEYYDYIWRFWETGDTLLIESKADLSYIHPEFGGTNDCVLIKPFGDVHVFDLKYGKGLKVKALDNPQLAAYALAAAETVQWDFDKIHMHICQPRVDDGFNTWVLRADELREWATRFEIAITKCEESTELNSGDHCKFCPAKPICPEMRKLAIKQTLLDFADTKPILKIPQELTMGQIIQVLNHADLLESWLGSVREYAHNQLERGNNVPGYKLVAKRAIRKWKNEFEIFELAENKFGIKAFDKKLKSPAQLEKIDKAFVDEHSEKVSSGTKIAPISDLRERQRPKIEQEFDDGI